MHSGRPPNRWDLSIMDTCNLFKLFQHQISSRAIDQNAFASWPTKNTKTSIKSIIDT